MLCLQLSFLRALRPETFRLLRLQLLDALLQAIDAALTIRALARQHVALPLLHDLPPLLDALLALLRTRFDLFLPRRSRAHDRRCAWPRWCGDARFRVPRHGRSLRRCGTMNFRSRRYDTRSGRSRWRSDPRGDMRGHGWTLWWGSCTERRRGGPCHSRRRGGACHRWRRRWAGHRRWWSCRSGCWRSCAAWTMASSILGGRAGAHRDRGHTKKKCCYASAAREHDLTPSCLSPGTINARAQKSFVVAMTYIAILRRSIDAGRLRSSLAAS
ncbi:hypothetical protein [Bradyrhizobium australiense]|uniref:hypothetical protein n=1 Tax=Bradyrhizobium australiense TaxID=2721161 RepID=UPI001F270AA9|nr:hypothetical protein [Bradyrhizobium australiense]